HNTALFLDAYLVGLHLAEILRLLYQMFLDGLALAASACPPRSDGAFVEAKRSDNGWHRTAMSEQRDHEADRLRSRPQAIHGGPFGSADRLVAGGTQAALLLTRVDADVALAALASGRTRQVRAECCCGVHTCPPSSVGEPTKRSMFGPPFALQVHLTT